MPTKSRTIIKRLLFWGIIILAPVAFFSMTLFYLNSYLTSERLTYFFTPFLSALTGQNAVIESAHINLGFKSTLTLHNISLQPAHDDTTMINLEDPFEINKATVNFRLLSLFFGPLEIDSLVFRGMRGDLLFKHIKPPSTITWRDESGTRNVSVNLTLSDLDGVKIKSFVVEDSNFRYKNDNYSMDLFLEDYRQNIRIDVTRLMNMVLVSGTVEGILFDASRPSDSIPFSIHGRMQLNVDDRSIYIRDGSISINEKALSFTAVMNKVEDQARWKVFCSNDRKTVGTFMNHLPTSLQKFFNHDDDPDLKIVFDFLFEDENVSS